MWRVANFAWLCVCCLGLCGCGQDEGKVVVMGLVTLDDQPLADAQVQFVTIPGGPEPGRAVFGAKTDSSGRYRTPAKPGRYKIIVLKWVRKDGYTIDPKRVDAAQHDAAQMDVQPRPDVSSPLRQAVPTEYTRDSKTPFTRDVAATAQTIDLELKSKTPGK